MKIVLLCVGKLRSSPIRKLCEDYASRVRRYGVFEIVEVKAADPGAVKTGMQQESERLLQALKSDDQIWVMDERGQQHHSADWAELFADLELKRTKRLVLILGGAYGLGDVIREKGLNMALSRMTFPHELCRVILLEQLYRARTIQRGEPYHH